MLDLFSRLSGQTQKKFEYSSVMVVYKTEDTTWRGFVMPFDITFEAESREKVVQVLRDMTNSYVEGLKDYNSPEHLSNVPLSYEKDTQKWLTISQDLTNKLLNRISKIESPDYYAEAQLPA